MAAAEAETPARQPAADFEYDERFEFDAPRYYDFEAMCGGTPSDRWFDTAPDGPGCKADKAAAVVAREPLQPILDQQHNQQQPASGEAAAASPVPPGKGKRSNLVTSWQRSPAGGGKGAQAPRAGRPQPSTDRGDGAGGSKAAAAAAVAAGASDNAAAAAAAPADAAAGPGHQRRTSRKSSLGVGARRICSGAGASVGGTKESTRSEPPVTRSMSRLGAQLCCSPVPEGKPRTVPSPPMTRSRKCVTAAKVKPAVPRTRPLSVQKLRQVLEPKVTKPPRSTQPLTLPNDFELRTSKRAGTGRPCPEAADQQAPGRSPFKSLAEKVREFQAKTPVRFRSKPEARPATARASQRHAAVTHAQSPQLMTSTRSRPARFKTQQELEEEQLEAARREQFHAKPLDTRVLASSGQLGVPRVDKPPPTEPRPFNLRSDSRARARTSPHEHPSLGEAAAAAAAAPPRFRAQPVRKSILDGPTFRPHKERHEATVPKSPLLRTKLRSHTAKADAAAEPRREQPARPASAHSSGSQQHKGCSSVPPKPTQPQPFHLATEARGALHQSELAAKLAAEEARARRLRRVTARPLPVTVDVPVVPPKPGAKPLTLPDPFELQSLARHGDYEERHMRQLQEEEEEARRAAEFKARPVPAAGPFVVHDSDAPLTVPAEPHLATDARAAERHDFDAAVAARAQRAEEEKRRREDLKRRQEEEATREYRKKLRFSARPMPSFDRPYFAAPSDKPLTNPKTPNFASKRLRRGGDV